jgi:uncharacterized membrane protein
MQTLLILYLATGLLLSILSIPLLLKKVKPNPFYGFRVQATLENAEIWYATNAHFARYQLAVGLITAAAALGLSFWPGISVDAYALACLAVFVLVFGTALVQGFRYLKKLTAH